MKDQFGNLGVPVVNLENPEIVKLRIAKEHIDSLFEMKQRRITSVLQVLWQKIDQIEKEMDEAIERNTWMYPHSIDGYFYGLIAYAIELGILEETFKQKFMGVKDGAVDEIPRKKEFLSTIRAKVDVWHNQQLNELEDELKKLLLQK